MLVAGASAVAFFAPDEAERGFFAGMGCRYFYGRETMSRSPMLRRYFSRLSRLLHEGLLVNRLCLRFQVKDVMT